MKRLALLLTILAAPLAAQHIHVGAKVGIPLNDAVNASTAYASESHHWTVGPTLEIDLPAGFGLEADLLYRRFGYKVLFDSLGAGSYNSGSYTFPLLVKYKFPGRMARLYVDAGFSFRAITDVRYLWDNTSKGFVMGGGIRYNLKAIQISPELRYTHWGNNVFNTPNLSSVKNQTDLLVGITF